MCTIVFPPEYLQCSPLLYISNGEHKNYLIHVAQGPTNSWAKTQLSKQKYKFPVLVFVFVGIAVQYWCRV